jgi:hypothetical protein
MRPFPADLMRMWPISTRVNKPENDDASIVEPIELAPDAAYRWRLRSRRASASNFSLPAIEDSLPRTLLAMRRGERGASQQRPQPSIFPLDVLLHAPSHLDQTAPNPLKERNHLVHLGIARQLELWLVGL